MADEVKHISEINLDNIAYAIKDSAAREALAALQALFENSLDTHDVKMFLYMDISKYEPRIKMSPMDIVIEETDEHTYTITCGFTVPSLNDATGTVSSTVKEE